MKRRIALLTFLALAAATLSSAEERRISRPAEYGNRPIEITSERLSADSTRNSVTFEGSVVARQEDVTLYSDRLHAEYTPGAGIIEKIVADGNVRVVQEDREARAPHAEFYNMEQRIVLTGGADVTQGGNTLTGESVTIYLRENRSVVSGGDGGRVKAVIQPKGLQGDKGKGSR